MGANKKFSELYGQLNAAQKEAVDAIDGPVMVIAGPGTGKTTILTLRIANILQKTDASADSILALTFTESGVRTMRQKLASLIGTAAYRVRLHTFHSFCNDLIQRYPDRFQRIIGSEHMEELEQIRLMQEIIDNLPLKMLRPRNDPGYYVMPCIKAIRELKRDAVAPPAFKKFIAEQESAVQGALTKGARALARERVRRNKELLRVYSAYEKCLAEKKLYDFEDMIIEAVRILEKDQGLLLKLQEEYQYILADEHQDANLSQNRLLELLASYDERPNLFIVGDEKQAIFRFQGASLENFFYFQRRFPTASKITLTHNYRSHQGILDAAYSLIKNAQSLGEREGNLKAISAAEVRKISIVEASFRQHERLFVAQEVARRCEKGMRPSDIAVLVRENKDAELAERALQSLGIPTARFSATDALQHVRINAFLELLDAIINPDDERLSRILFFDFLAVDAHSAFVAVQAAKKERVPLFSVLRKDPRLSGLAKKILEWGKIAANEPLVEAFGQIAEKSGFRRHLLSLTNGSELLRLFEVLLRTVERVSERNRHAQVKNFLDYLAQAKKHSIVLQAESALVDGVAVMTAHRAKGLEFDTVFILHGNDGIWGGRRSRSFFDLPPVHKDNAISTDRDTEDERRLFYVALTRAKNEVIITYHHYGEDGRQRLPSQFIGEIDESLRLQLVASPEPVSTEKTQPRPKLLSDKAYLRSLFVERGLSITHVNNFLLCPWRYFFVDLIRLPQSQNAALLYGSAIHAALRSYFDSYAREEDIRMPALLKLFEGYLRRTYLSQRDFKSFLSSGRKELQGYLTAWRFPRSIYNEVNIGGVPLELQDGQKILLTGKLDKVELLSGDLVNVVDYKTGKPKSRNEVDGKTKSSDGNYKRQLVFYKLLVDAGSSWKMKTGTIDFIKPDEKGRYHREVFEIDSNEVDELKKLVADVATQIADLTFWGKTCGDTKCSWCALSKVVE